METRTLLLGDWSQPVRDPIDLSLRLGIGAPRPGREPPRAGLGLV
jgi:hypothetical protein